MEKLFKVNKQRFDRFPRREEVLIRRMVVEIEQLREWEVEADGEWRLWR